MPATTIRWMRENRLTQIDAECDCGHQASVSIENFPDDVKVPDLRFRMRCSVCGKRPRMTRPSWVGYGASGTGNGFPS